MTPRALCCVLVGLAMIVCGSACVALPCFPGAEGFGTDTPGGRGGRVIYVTNLEDSGPGSLRAACEAKGPRIVVFGISGTIRLAKALRITEPYITIAGQSAPGAGIMLRDAVFQIQTHDVLVRFIRVRVGPSLNEAFNDQNSIEISGEDSYNVVVDHCSFSWSIDEDAGIVSRAHDCTFSYNIVSEPLREPFTATKIGKERSHSMAMILGNYPDHCSVHHDLLTDANSRNPRIQGGTHDFVNNVVYDWGFLTATFSRDPNVNFIGNYYKPGPSSKAMKALVNEKDMGRVYVRGNRTPDRPSDDLPEWEPLTDADPAEHRAMEPFATAPLTTTSAEQAYKDVLAGAGCRVPKLDAVDARIIRQVYLGTGMKIDRPAEVGGYPDMPIVEGPRDSDRDGMPDSYEIAHGLDPHNPADAARSARSGYTNIENYLNEIVEKRMTEPPLVVSYPVPDGVTDSPYSVTVNGKPVPIEQGGTIQGAYYARFQFTKQVRGTVAVAGGAAARIELSPERYRDNVALDKNSVSFDVFQPGPRVITATVDGHDLWPLVIIAEEYDPSAPQSAGPVLDVADLGVTHDGVQTANIQRALDACAARPGGGVVYFGPGVYHTGTLYVGDNTTVYLAPGCLIQASEDPNDFPVDKGRKEQGSHGPVSSSSRVIMFDHCTNSKLSGYGVIDGMGHVIRNKHGRHVQLVDVTASRNVRIENVVLRNSAEWTVHILASDRVFIDNLKIINDYKVGNTDGIDPDGSTNVYITRYFGHCGDDALAIKTTGNSDLLQPARNINVRDCIVMTRKTAYKIGTETYADISDVLFQDCDAVNSSRGIGIWCRDGGVISDVTYRDMSFDLHEIEGESHSGEPIYVSVEKRNGIGKVVDVLFDRVVSRAPYRSLFEGMAQSKLTDFKLWGCRFYLKPREIKMGRQPVISIADADGFQFRFTYLQRPADDDQNWNGFIEAKDSENIVSRELEETRADN